MHLIIEGFQLVSAYIHVCVNGYKERGRSLGGIFEKYQTISAMSAKMLAGTYFCQDGRNLLLPCHLLPGGGNCQPWPQMVVKLHYDVYTDSWFASIDTSSTMSAGWRLLY